MIPSDPLSPTMKKYKKKPIALACSQWFKPGDHPSVVPVPYDHPNHVHDADSEWGWINDLEGGHLVSPGDWIITGVRGEHYACKPEIFAETYEPADPQPADPLPSPLQAVTAVWICRACGFHCPEETCARCGGTMAIAPEVASPSPLQAITARDLDDIKARGESLLRIHLLAERGAVGTELRWCAETIQALVALCEQQENELAQARRTLADPMVCEFCNATEGEIPSFLEVCSACWNRANEGSGWMQRCEKAEAEVSRLAAQVAQQATEIEKLQKRLRAWNGERLPEAAGSTAKISEG